jgi:hypothetical protein
MPTYVSLLNWTDQGVKKFKETVDRAGKVEPYLSGLEDRSRNSGASRVEPRWTKSRCRGTGRTVSVSVRTRLLPHSASIASATSLSTIPTTSMAW